MLNNTQAAPLGDRPNTGRTSLAGVQEKIVFLRDQGCGLDDARFVDRRHRWNARTRHRAFRPIIRCTPRTNPSGRHGPGPRRLEGRGVPGVPGVRREALARASSRAARAQWSRGVSAPSPPTPHALSSGRQSRKFLHAAITVDDLIEEAQSWKLRSPRTIVMETLDSVKRFVQSEAPVENTYDRLRVDISACTRNLVEGRPTGHRE